MGLYNFEMGMGTAYSEEMANGRYAILNPERFPRIICIKIP